jgi:hypothetical protein
MCSKEWQKPGETEDDLVSYGLCPRCEALYEKVIDGEMTLEEAKEKAK